jgi:uncharacterized membrane protein YedE/YeeE
MNWIMEPWPWWVSGILVGLVVPLLRFLAGRDFGISTSLQQFGAMCWRKCKFDYLKAYDARDGIWLVLFVVGIAAGGFIGAHVLSSKPIEFLPDWSYGTSGAIKLFAGGILVGFGARYANGCTSGHAITGIANGNWPSMVATVCFFVGGLAVTWGVKILFQGGVQ